MSELVDGAVMMNDHLNQSYNEGQISQAQGDFSNFQQLKMAGEAKLYGRGGSKNDYSALRDRVMHYDQAMQLAQTNGQVAQTQLNDVHADMAVHQADRDSHKEDHHLLEAGLGVAGYEGIKHHVNAAGRHVDRTVTKIAQDHPKIQAESAKDYQREKQDEKVVSPLPEPEK